MRIFIMTMGTRGDLELFLTLGRALQGRGHQIVLGASPLFQPRVREAGLEFTPLGTGTHEEHLATLRSLINFPDPLQRVREYARRWLLPQLELSWREIQYLANRAEYFINNLKLLLKRPDNSAIPGAWVNYDPPFSEENRKTYDATQPSDGTILNLVAMNQQLVDPQDQWGERYHFTGFWRAERSPGDPPPELVEFLKAGPPPVVLTMGSMVMFDAARLAGTFTEALRRSGQRGVIVGGWAGLALGAAPVEVKEPPPVSVMVGGWTGLAAAAVPPPPMPASAMPASPMPAAPVPAHVGMAAPGAPAVDTVMSSWVEAFPVSLGAPLPPSRAVAAAQPVTPKIAPAPVVSADGAVICVTEAPYEWLFPQAACVIHHGGCGTLAAVMRAGIPSILLPQIPPQELFGRLLQGVHLATGSFDVCALDPVALTGAIQRAVMEADVRQACRTWQEAVANDPGVPLAVDFIENHAKGLPTRATAGRRFGRSRDKGGW